MECTSPGTHPAAARTGLTSWVTVTHQRSGQKSTAELGGLSRRPGRKSPCAQLLETKPNFQQLWAKFNFPVGSPCSAPGCSFPRTPKPSSSCHPSPLEDQT